MDEKRFNQWMDIKEGLHRNGKLPRIKEGEVYWCGIGENVGVEINGKSDMFSRPVLVMKKLSRYGFLGIPLTSQKHVGSWYVEFKFQGNEEVAVLSQQRVLSVSRLYSRMGQVDECDLARIKEGFHDLYCK